MSPGRGFSTAGLSSFTSAPLLSGSAMWWLGPALWAQEKGGQYFLSIPVKVLGLHCPELAGATCTSAHGRMDRPDCPGCFTADFRASRVKQPLVNLKDGRWITPHTVPKREGTVITRKGRNIQEDSELSLGLCVYCVVSGPLRRQTFQ